MTTANNIHPDQLPAPIRSYLAAHEALDTDTALRAFSPIAVVVDEGITYSGTDEVRRFLDKAGSAYTYTSTLVSAECIDSAHWIAVVHLEGDFAGRVIDLRYRFVMDGDSISELVITP